MDCLDKSIVLKKYLALIHEWVVSIFWTPRASTKKKTSSPLRLSFQHGWNQSFSCENRAVRKNVCLSYLVGGFNPFEKYARQIGSFPQVGVKIKIWNHHLDFLNGKKTHGLLLLPVPVWATEPSDSSSFNWAQFDERSLDTWILPHFGLISGFQEYCPPKHAEKIDLKKHVSFLHRPTKCLGRNPSAPNL